MQTKIKHQFSDPAKILAYAGIPKGACVADFGCGNGFYPVAVAKLVGDSGTVYAVDVVEESLEATISAAKQQGLANVFTIKHDLAVSGVKVKDGCCDAVILSGILHLEKLQKNVIKETYRVLKTGGKVIVIEWKKEPLPFGPDINRRLSQNEVQDLLVNSGFRYQAEIPADSFHYAMVFVK